MSRRVKSSAVALWVGAALLVIAALPVSQLRLITVATSCCCPDPSICHCPDHKADTGKQPSMRACHKVQHDIVSPEAPAVDSPVIVSVVAPVRIADAPLFSVDQPHASPAPRRPDAPS